MTGFGRCEVQKENRKFTVELKSVNHRYLDVNIRMPKKLNFFETSIRTLLKSYASRGKVDIFITYEDASQSQVSVRYHAGIAGEYLKYLQQMETEFGLENDIRVSSLARFPEVFTMEEQAEDEDKLWNGLKEALEGYKEALEDESAEELKDQLSEECHYVMEPELTYTYFADAARNNSFNREQLQKGFNNIEQSDPIFADLFTDIDLYSNRLGAGDQKQSDTVASLIKEIDKADLLNSDAEILGNAYEYLIGQFASETGKKAGEFYTPQAVSKILTKIAISGQEDKKGLSVYDPCMGSGSLLLNAKKYASAPEYIKYYGQEQNTSTYNLARMNMFLHGIVAENQHLRNGDTLDGDWPTGEETDFNMVLMNPPYSAKWSAAAGFLQDERFSDYGVLAPKSKADYAFLLHGLYHLKNNGTMAIVLPHGVLFRGAAEGKIREKLLRSGNIYAVIGLPANLFYNTSIPTCIIVLKKHRDGRDVLFIDASKKFNKGKKQNEMTDEHIDEVLALYSDRKTVEKESYLASFEDIEKNDFNLNIPRYVDNFEKEEDVDINTLLQDMKKTDDELEQVKGDFVSLLKDLTSPDQNIIFSLNDLIRKLEG